jgi:hypothetical protein
MKRAIALQNTSFHGAVSGNRYEAQAGIKLTEQVAGDFADVAGRVVEYEPEATDAIILSETPKKARAKK